MQMRAKPFFAFARILILDRLIVLRRTTMERAKMIQGIAATGEALIEKWQADQRRLEGKDALGITLSAKERADLLFYRAFLTIAMDRREAIAA
jgi:hypothetical protein